MSGDSLAPEWSVLLTACSFLPSEEKLASLRQLLRNPIDWKALFDLAERQGCLPLIHQSLSPLSDVVPSEPFRALHDRHGANLVKALLLARELIRIVEQLSALGIEAMPYKGLALAEVLYRDISMRQAGDIDLLIRPDDFRRACEAVQQIGYRAQHIFSDAEAREYLKSGYECAFDGTAGPNLLEFQWAILPRFYSIDFDMDALFHRGAVVSVAGRDMKTPSREDLLLVLSAHAAKHVWGRLVWLRDIAMLLSVCDLNWDWIASQAHELGIERILCVTISLAHVLLQSPIPAPAQRIIARDQSVDLLVAETQAQILTESQHSPESLPYFKLMLRLRERRSDRRRFIQRLALTPGPGEWQLLRLPPILFPLYRLLRLSRLAARLARA